MGKSILVVDDEIRIQKILAMALREAEFDVKLAGTFAAAHDVLSSGNFDAIIIDQMLPDGKGIDLISELRASGSDMAIVIITGMGDIPLAVEAMRRGADTFITKPVVLADLVSFLQKSLEIRSLRRLSNARKLTDKKVHFDFGKSKAMRSVMELAGLASGSEAPVLMLGETGVGKGVLARWIHENSPRSSGAFIEVNCSCLRGDLLASELFGHAKGAFTSAVQDRQGFLDVADGGTLFLDEIGDMDLSVQAQFLKAIEDKTYRRLGEVRDRKSNFRLICASNKEITGEAAQGKFRKDLLFRIQVLPIQIPALRERSEDIPGLVRHLLAAFNYQHRDVSLEVMVLLDSYPWSGNVRELRNVLERALLHARGGELRTEHFPGLWQCSVTEPAEPRGELEQLEMESIKAALERFGGDVNKTAEALGISRATIYRRIKKSKDLS